ncbi:MAG: zinc ABC transporter substrate-binding protein [Candidatus Latescibacterota bacterium]
MKKALCILMLLLIQTAPTRADTGKGNKMPVFVTILPMAYFIERIGGEHVDVNVLVGPGQSPESFEPTSKQLVQLAGARAFFSIGVPFEAEIVKRIQANFGNVEIVKTHTGIQLKESGHHHGVDPHIWLDPNLATIIAGNIYIGLAQLDPDRQNEYERNAKELIYELSALDKEISEMLASFAGRKMYVFHPAFGYFAEAFGLVQISIEEGGAEPGSRHLAGIIHSAREENVPAIFTQPQFSGSSVRTIAKEIGADIIILDPLSRDYIRNMKYMAQQIKQAFNDE